MEFGAKILFMALLLFFEFIALMCIGSVSASLNTLDIIVSCITVLWFITELFSIGSLNEYDREDRDVMYKYGLVLLPFTALSIYFLYLGGLVDARMFASLYIYSFIYMYYLKVVDCTAGFR